MVKFNSKLTSTNQDSENNQNYEWWNENPMTYDWDQKIDSNKIDLNFFKNIDNEFAYGHSLVNNPEWPKGHILEKFIPYQRLTNKKVLEIGCGAGLVSQHLAMAGSDLTTIDITEKAIELTKKRFDLNKIEGKIIKMDAENTSFNNDFFDYIISWGVIHHSGNMNKIIDEIYRVLNPNGKAFIMVYNKNSLRYRFYCLFWLGIIRGQLLKKNIDQIAGSITDGYIARHLTEKDVSILFSKFRNIEITYSDEINTISMYLLGPFNRLLNFLPKILKIKFEKYLSKKFGWYMQIIITK